MRNARTYKNDEQLEPCPLCGTGPFYGKLISSETSNHSYTCNCGECFILVENDNSVLGFKLDVNSLYKGWKECISALKFLSTHSSF